GGRRAVKNRRADVRARCRVGGLRDRDHGGVPLGEPVLQRVSRLRRWWRLRGFVLRRRRFRRWWRWRRRWGRLVSMLVCCGLTTLDVTQVVDRLPEPNEKLTGRELTVAFGGPAANAAATAVALGVPT